MVNFQSLVLCMLAAGSASAAVMKRYAQDGHAYDCGCSSRKKKLVCKGANARDIAVGLQETGGKLDAHAYPYGDGKTSDAANFGLFKNNWFMIRTSCSQFKGQGPNDYHNGAALNDDDAAAIKCQHEQMAKYGNKWLAGQRNGPSGIQNPNDGVVGDYQQGLDFITQYIQQGHLTDNMATYANVQAI